MIRIKRIYDPPADDDGHRVLVDRLWPRGMSRAAVAVELWAKECAPSDALRRWSAHDRAKWAEFRRRYFAELDARPEALAPLRALGAQGTLTLLYAAADRECNNAVALRDYLGQAAQASSAAAGPKNS